MANSRTLDDLLPFVPWDEFIGRYFRWQQRHHLTMLGPTDAGKTTFLHAILPPTLALRRRVVVIATKPTRGDTSLDRFVKAGYLKIAKWPPPSRMANRVILWPEYRRHEDLLNQRKVIGHALREIFADRGQWTVVLDEMHYLVKRLHLVDEIETLLHQGRSVGLTVVSGAQRPAHIPLVTYSSAKWLVAFKTNDGRDLLRLSEFAGPESRFVRSVIARLGEHEALIAGPRDLLVRTKVSL